MGRRRTRLPWMLKLLTRDLEQLRRQALGYRGATELYAEPGLSVVRLPGGHLVELYGQAAAYPAYLFRTTNSVFSYQVDNLAESLQEAEGCGMALVASGEKTCNGYTFLHLADADGCIIELLPRLARNSNRIQ